MPPFKKFKTISYVLSGAGIVFCGVCLYKGNENFYKKIIMPVIFNLEPETAHALSINLLKWNIYPRMTITKSDMLKVQYLGLDLANPIGLAAGCDKNGLVMKPFYQTGFSFIEVGSVTPLPQIGNPKPRIYRLIPDTAIINRLGFNNEGFDVVYKRVKAFRDHMIQHFDDYGDHKLGVNLGKNKASTSLYQDYIAGIRKFHSVTDYLVINISSPNTPGLRDIQREGFLEPLLFEINKTKNEIIKNQRNEKFPLIFLKISPDMNDSENDHVAQTVLKWNKHCIDGLIIANTTVSRPSELNSAPELINQAGGLSGKPLFDTSTNLIKQFYRKTQGKIMIIGVGGVSNGQDAYDKIRSGASLIQLYTALLYQGPPVIPKILRELEALLKRDGYTHVSQAVGTDVK
ncbi:unnamed protein product [Gordionus sp. m RMFG-2023]|uniref:dihydroorotate dehydrogenase (quinone), mitochondrial-like n=1 Tax=Gordionus sp. m RMFG-2023 TaxID=3053472 RepID=UPI0030E475DF